MVFRVLFLILLALLPAAAFELPSRSSQCLVGIADGWDSSTVTLCFYEKHEGRWAAAGAPWKARLGAKGLIWGHGLHPVPAEVATKKEGDLRSPAGVFSIGGAWGSDAKIEKHPELVYHRVTSRDLWVEDSGSPQYNRHVILDHEPMTAWEKKQQMKQNDPVHSLKLFIGHNAAPNIIPNAGSSIFFHIWRAGGTRATAGCTTMDKPKLQSLVSKIDPTRQPLYVLLPKAEYEKWRNPWKLP
jgi:L,D-peptidoglycan transpeptidase YkuD (ErfK/YbiS/YcfS/YnhG family)